MAASWRSVVDSRGEMVDCHDAGWTRLGGELLRLRAPGVDVLQTSIG